MLICHHWSLVAFTGEQPHWVCKGYMYLSLIWVWKIKVNMKAASHRGQRVNGAYRIFILRFIDDNEQFPIIHNYYWNASCFTVNVTPIYAISDTTYDEVNNWGISLSNRQSCVYPTLCIIILTWSHGGQCQDVTAILDRITLPSGKFPRQSYTV